MKRVPSNTNLHIHNEATYQGLNIQTQHGLVVKNYLDRAYECFNKSLDQYGRVCMMRFDLHVPENCASSALTDNNLINRFISSLKAKIDHSQSQSRKQGHRVHETNVRFLWCREVSDTNRVHFHIALFLNNNAYAFVGKFKLENSNMYSRIYQAWGSALSTAPEDIQGLIHFPENHTYLISRDDEQSFQDAFYRTSYMCKMNSKEFNNHHHSFGFSRV